MPPPLRFDPKHDPASVRRKIRRRIAGAVRCQTDRLAPGNLFDVEILRAIEAPIGRVSQQLAIGRQRGGARESGIAGEPRQCPGRSFGPRGPVPPHQSENNGE
jgi:hypothetical protein